MSMENGTGSIKYPNKPTILIDFDGVIHSYTSGWHGETVISDPPVPGIREALIKCCEKYHVAIFSSRCMNSRGTLAMELWLEEHDIPYHQMTAQKIPALVMIDDRAICFKGDSENLFEQIGEFKTWTNLPKLL